MTPLFQILIASVWSRTDQLHSLLDHLAVQTFPYNGAVQVLIDRDDCLDPVGVKRTRLVEAATAPFIAFVDDDDWVSDDYIQRIMLGIDNAPWPDYVGFRVQVELNGRRVKDAVHSLIYKEWGESDSEYQRDISHINPIRRDITLHGLPFRDGFGEDQEWAAKIRTSGLAKGEVFLGGPPLYVYRYSSCGSLFAGGPKSLGYDPGLRSFPFVRVLSGQVPSVAA